jgi:hypothetical protein
MTIICNDIAQFLDCIEGLVQRGLGFKADADKLTITLTGAY